MIIHNIPSFQYFKRYISVDKTSKILDFGSNWGNYIDTNPDVFDNKNYTGVDVDKEAIEQGKKLFPEATWIWYNRYNPIYNPNGEKVFPKFEHKFDVIVSYSVFSHLDIDETLEILDFLYDNLNPGGKICFSYCNIDRPECVDWFRARRENPDQIPSQNYAYLINNKISLEPPREPVVHFVSFYKTEWLLERLSKYNAESKPPYNVWFQDAIVITR